MTLRYQVATRGVLGSTVVLDEFMLLDSAIVNATNRSRSSTVNNYVIQSGGPGNHAVRGYATNGTWKWVTRCKPCNGEGKIRTKAGGETACGKCHERGFVDEVRP